MSAATQTAPLAAGASAAPTSRAESRASDSWIRLVIVVGGVTAALTIMLLAFITPSIHSGAKDLPLAIGGTSAGVDRFTTTLNEKNPDAFDVTHYGSLDDVVNAVGDRREIGGVYFDKGDVTVVTAAGAGTPYVNVLNGVGQQLAGAGQHVTYREVAPLTQDDPMGVAMTSLGLPLAFGGMFTAVLLSTMFKRNRLQRFIGALAISALGGMVVAAVLHYGFAAIGGNYWMAAAGLAMGIAAISLTITGLESLLSFPGLGIGALLMMFVANPLSGLASGWQWLPHPWGTIGQLMPIGATGTVVRSVSFFDGHGMGSSLLVLSVWMGVGILLIALSADRARRALPAEA